MLQRGKIAAGTGGAMNAVDQTPERLCRNLMAKRVLVIAQSDGLNHGPIVPAGAMHLQRSNERLSKRMRLVAHLGGKVSRIHTRAAVAGLPLPRSAASIRIVPLAGPVSDVGLGGQKSSSGIHEAGEPPAIR